MRWARAVAAVSIPGLLLSANLPDDPAPVVSPLILAVLVAGALLMVNVVDPARIRAADADVLRHRAVVELGIDTAAVVSVVWLAGSDPKGSLWVLLVLPILEAALRFGTRTSTVLLGSMVVTYVARDAWASAQFEMVSFSPATVVQRVGVLVVVGLTAGFLASQLSREATRHQDARAEAVRRAEMLEVVADAARRMTTLDVGDVYRNLLAAPDRLGVADIGIAFRKGHGWIGRRAHGSVGGDVRDTENELDGAAVDLADDIAAGQIPLTLGPKHLDAAGRSDLPGAVGVPIVVSGDVRAVLLVAQIVSDDLLGALELLAGQAGAVLAQAEAHAEIRRLQQRLAYQALHDSLTGLPNRANFDLRLRRRQESGESDRRNGGDGVAVLFIDLDGFKTINDTLGHKAGDRTLEVVASRIRETIRPGDSVARLGGDEFVVLLDRTVNLEGARAAAERILDVLLASPIRLGRHQVTVGASVGVAFRDEVPDDPDKLIRLADRAMYEAKRTGRGRIVAIDDVEGSSNRSARTEQIAG
jgi:diguanylate cyclase (GGDEF)-like protein